METRTAAERREALAPFTTDELRAEMVERYRAEPQTERFKTGQARFDERIARVKTGQAGR